MNDFDFDVREKKRIAASARHRVCGSRSKHCFLPSDRLTKAQLAKRNGPVATFNMSGPMSWDMFDQLPQDLKGEYLIGLRDRFNPSPAQLGRMFGLPAATTRRNLQRQKLLEVLNRHARMTEEQSGEWERFIGIKPDPIGEPALPGIDPEMNQLWAALAGAEIRRSGPASELIPWVLQLLGTYDAQMSVVLSFPEKEDTEHDEPDSQGAEPLCEDAER